MYYFDHLIESLEYHLKMPTTYYNSGEECFNTIKRIIVGLAPLYNCVALTSFDDLIIWKERCNQVYVLFIQPKIANLEKNLKRIEKKFKIKEMLIITDERKSYAELLTTRPIIIIELPIDESIIKCTK